MATDQPPLRSTTTELPPKRVTQNTWIWQDDRMLKKQISFVPYFYKVVDELLVNAANNTRLNRLKVQIDTVKNSISVESNVVDILLPRSIIFDGKLSDYVTELTIENPDGNKTVFTRDGKKSELKDCRKWNVISVQYDLAKFGMKNLEDDTVALLKKRVIDLAGCSRKGVKVKLHGTRGPCQTFANYVRLYLSTSMRVQDKVNNWEIWVGLSDGEFEQVSFLNNFATMNGGSHLDLVTGQIISHLAKNEASELRGRLKNCLWVFVNAFIDNLAFELEPNEKLTINEINEDSFRSKWVLSPDFLEKVADLGVVARSAGLMHNGKLNIQKFEDAKCAATCESKDCTLIITEGDSALSFVKSGLSGLCVVSQDHYGIFPLTGKMINVRRASPKKLHNNREIHIIKKILGLRHGRRYENTEELRYGRLMIFADQNDDGFHIVGLLINFLQFFWPSLLEISGFLCIVKSPRYKVCFLEEETVMYSKTEYWAWKKKLGNNASKYKLYVYEGLASNNVEEAKECFAHLNSHTRSFLWVNHEDHDSFELAFSKKKIKNRKDWIISLFKAGSIFFFEGESIRYLNFMNHLFRQFSVTNLQRAVPSIIDGFKPSQRKIMHTAFKSKLVDRTKISVLAADVISCTLYDHASRNITKTIIHLARNYVGCSNNINLLEPMGQFGSRIKGGKDHGHDDYLFTQLPNITKYIFRKEDEVLFKKDAEPICLVPIIPVALVNGSNGTGSGWSTFIPSYKPLDIVCNLKLLLNGKPMLDMCPWYRWFNGRIESTIPSSFTTTATYEVIEDENALCITELPVKMWTETYQTFLDAALLGGKGKTPFIKDYEAYNDDDSVYIKVYMTEDQKDRTIEHLLKKFKLTTKFSLDNMHLFDANGVLKKYLSPSDILREFYDFRLKRYEHRMTAQLDALKKDKLELKNKARYIELLLDHKINPFNRKPDELSEELKVKGFESLPEKGFHYLISTGIEFWTRENVDNLRQKLVEKEEEIKLLGDVTPESLYQSDLDALYKQLEKQDKEDEIVKRDRAEKIAKIVKEARKKTAVAERAVKRAAKRAADEELEDGDSSHDSEHSDNPEYSDIDSDDNLDL